MNAQGIAQKGKSVGALSPSLGCNFCAAGRYSLVPRLPLSTTKIK